MLLKVIGTGSSGNAYLLQEEGQGGQALLLDAGLPIRKIIGAAQEWRSIAGCLITHEHGDHYKAARDVAAMGIPTYATRGTIEAEKRDYLTVINEAAMLSSFQVGRFTALPFPTQHDAAEPCGWLIRSNATGETALYATDTYYLQHTYPGVHYWIVECNYCEEVVAEQLSDGAMTEQLRNRLMKSHMSLRRLCDALRANDLRETRAIILVHLSDERSDAKVMVETIKQVTGIEEVYAAQAGAEYALRLAPF